MNKTPIAVYHQVIPQTCCAQWINEVSRIIKAVGKHVGAEDSLAGGGVGVGVEEAAQLGIVVAGLEVIELGVSSLKCPIRPFLRPS